MTHYILNFYGYCELLFLWRIESVNRENPDKQILRKIVLNINIHNKQKVVRSIAEEIMNNIIQGKTFIL